MPNRILREAIITSRAISLMSDSGQLFYRCLMSVVDDYGRFEADLDLLRARCFPRQLDRWPLSRVSDALSECGEARSSDGEALLRLYSGHDSSKKYCQINNFGQRIRADKKGNPTPSKYPAPPNGSEAPLLAAESGVNPPKTNALTNAESKTETNAQSGPPPQVMSEFPKTSAAICRRFPSADAVLVARIVEASAHAFVNVDAPKIPEPTDSIYAQAVEVAAKNANGKQSSAALFLKTVPTVIGNWAKHGKPRDPNQVVYFDPRSITG